VTAPADAAHAGIGISLFDEEKIISCGGVTIKGFSIGRVGCFDCIYDSKINELFWAWHLRPGT